MSYPILKVGSRGADVLHLKALLAVRGLMPSSDDATFYKATAEAVAVYQATHLGPDGRFLLEQSGLVPGVVDMLTWGALEGVFLQSQGAPHPIPVGKVELKGSPRKKYLNVLAGWYHAGVKEMPKGSNSDDGGIIDEMQKFHGMKRQPWCAMAVNFAHWKAFGTLPPWGKDARVSSIWNSARKNKIASVSGYLDSIIPGDLGVYLSAPLKSDGSARDVNGHIFTLTGTDRSLIFGLDGNSDDRVRASERNRRYLTGVIRLFPAENIVFDGVRYESGDAGDR